MVMPVSRELILDLLCHYLTSYFTSVQETFIEKLYTRIAYLQHNNWVHYHIVRHLVRHLQAFLYASRPIWLESHGMRTKKINKQKKRYSLETMISVPLVKAVKRLKN